MWLISIGPFASEQYPSIVSTVDFRSCGSYRLGRSRMNSAPLASTVGLRSGGPYQRTPSLARSFLSRWIKIVRRPCRRPPRVITRARSLCAMDRGMGEQRPVTSCRLSTGRSACIECSRAAAPGSLRSNCSHRPRRPLDRSEHPRLRAVALLLLSYLSSLVASSGFF